MAEMHPFAAFGDIAADTATASECASAPANLEREVFERVPAALEAHRAARFDEAAALYRRVLALQPEHAGVLHMLGLVVWRTGNLLDGIALIGRALRIDPRTAGARGNLSNALHEVSALAQEHLKAEQPAEGIDLYRRAFAAVSDDVGLAHELARALWRVGDYHGAQCLADDLRRRAESDRSVQRTLSTLSRQAGAPGYGDLAGRGVAEAGRFFGALRPPVDRRPTVLIPVEGEWHHWLWGQIAIAFHRAGCRAVMVRLQPGCFRECAAAGGFYDLVILNQVAMNHFWVDVGTAPDVDWHRHFHAFAMLQYHDVCSELFTLLRAADLTRRYGFPIYHWSYCTASAAFLRKHFPEHPVFECPPPLSAEELVLFDPDFGRTHLIFELDETRIGRVDAYLAGGAGRERPGTADCAVYYGAYEDTITFHLNPEAALKPAEVAALGRAYREAVGTPTRVGFMDWLIESGRVRLDRGSIRSLTDLGEYLWIFSRAGAYEERGRFAASAWKRFGDRVRIYGGNWDRLGVGHLPADFASWPFSYAAAKVCIDFGSQYIDSGLYQRTLQVIGFGGRLLQGRKYDSDLVYGRHASELCFNDEEDLLERLGRILDEPPGTPAAWREANAAFLERTRPERVARLVLSAVFGE